MTLVNSCITSVNSCITLVNLHNVSKFLHNVSKFLHTVYIVGWFVLVGEKFRSKDERTNVELECLLELERTDEVVEKLTELLHKTPDQWSFIRTYVNCQIQRYLRMKEKGEGGVEGSGDSIQLTEGGSKRHEEDGPLQLPDEEEASGSKRVTETPEIPEDEQRTSGGGPSVQECGGTRYVHVCAERYVDRQNANMLICSYGN